MKKLTIFMAVAIACCSGMISFPSSAGYTVRAQEEEKAPDPLEEISEDAPPLHYDFTAPRKQKLVIGTETRMRTIVEPSKMDERFYVRGEAALMGGAIAAHLKFKEAHGLDPLSGYPDLVKKAARESTSHRGAAIGYQWKSFALEGEYVGIGKINYNSSPDLNHMPLGKPNLFRVTSNIRSTAFLVNGLYLMEQTRPLPWLTLYPYAMMGLGYGNTTATASTIPLYSAATLGINSINSQDLKKIRKGLALSLGAGLRARLSEHFVLDTAIRGHLWPKANLVIYESFDDSNVGGGAVQSFKYTLEPKVYASAAWYLGLTFLF